MEIGYNTIISRVDILEYFSLEFGLLSKAKGPLEAHITIPTTSGPKTDPKKISAPEKSVFISSTLF